MEILQLHIFFERAPLYGVVGVIFMDRPVHPRYREDTARLPAALLV
jgi:hypothetical protein